MAEGLVLDSWPILEWIKNKQPAAGLFTAILLEARAGKFVLEMSRINFGEVIYSIQKARDVADKAWALQAFLNAPLRVWSVDDALVDEAVALKSSYAFSYADAFAAALAIRRGLPLVTGDGEFRPLEAAALLQLHWVGA